MTTYVVFGEAGASKKLITASLNDYLDAHQINTPDDDFCFIVCCEPRQQAAIDHVIEWCEKAEIYFEQVSPSESYAFSEQAGETIVDPNHMIVAVERGYAYSADSTVVLALVGEDEPSVEVRRAIARAIDSHMVVRDLSEGGLTYIKFHGDAVDTPPHLEDDMADEATEEVTLEVLVALAAEGDEEAIEALTEACEEFRIDPDEYATWEEVGELLEAAMEDGEEEPEEEPEEEDSGEEGGWTAEALKGLTLKDLREHAQAAGVPNWKTAPRAELTKILIAGTAVEEEEVEEAPAKPAKAKTVKTEVGDLPAFDIDALADAIIDRLIARLK